MTVRHPAVQLTASTSPSGSVTNARAHLFAALRLLRQRATPT